MKHHTENHGQVKEFTAKYKSICVACGRKINPGDRIKYEKSEGSWHAECELVPVPADAIFLSGGEGYGCAGWHIGQVVVNEKRKTETEPEFLYVLRAAQTHYDEDGLSFGVGYEQGYVFTAACRAATDKESAPLRAAIAEQKRKSDAETERKAIAKLIRETGEFPEKATSQGMIITDRQNIYGGGDWFVIGEDKIWYVKNNGADSDDWSRNNIGTGGLARSVGLWNIRKN